MGETTVVFVRHGDRPRPKDKITPLGRAQARVIGAWLADQGYDPDLFVHTRTVRTRETLEGVAEAMGSAAPIRPVPGGFQDFAGLERVVAGETGLVVFCAHHPMQGFLQRTFQLPMTAADRGVVVLRSVDGAWSLVTAARCEAGLDPPTVEVLST